MKRGKPRPNWYEPNAWCYYTHMQRMCGTQPIARMLQKQGCPVEVALVFLAGRPNVGIRNLVERYITPQAVRAWSQEQVSLASVGNYHADPIAFLPEAA
jgi:hypothetical protein